MSIFNRRGDSTMKYAECRLCGTTLDGIDEECPHCEETAVAVYRL
jgi:rubrerythrin